MLGLANPALNIQWESLSTQGLSGGSVGSRKNTWCGLSTAPTVQDRERYLLPQAGGTTQGLQVLDDKLELVTSPP